MEFYIKIKTNSIAILLFLLFSIIGKAQENSYWELNYSKGSILEHKQLVSFLFREHPSFYTIGWFKTASPDSAWEESYNYPDRGFVLIHQDFHNKKLGTTTGLNYATTFYLLNRNNKNQFSIQLGFGAAYNSNPLDFDTNLSNIVMSSHLLFSNHIKINYAYPKLFHKIGLNAGISFSHFSNGALVKPNLGLNTVFLNIGMNFHNEKIVKYEKHQREKMEKQPLHFTLGVGGGIHETLPNIGAKPIYYLSAQLSKRITYKTGILLGFDLFNSMSIKDLAVYNAINDPDPNARVKDYKQVGMFLGKETFFNKISFNVKIGYYLYRPVPGATSIYETISFKRYFKDSKKSAISINLKTHLFEAEHITIGYHHQIF
jgi:hypothetical protein